MQVSPLPPGDLLLFVALPEMEIVTLPFDHQCLCPLEVSANTGTEELL